MNMGESLWNCTIDGSVASRSLPAGVGFKPPSAAAFKRCGSERLGKRRSKERQVSIEKMSESEPLRTHRKVHRHCQNWRRPVLLGQARQKPVYGFGGSRCISGMSLI